MDPQRFLNARGGNLRATSSALAFVGVIVMEAVFCRS